MVETGKKLKTITWEECEKRINKEFMHDTDYDIFCGDYHGRELIRVHFFVHGAKYFRSVLKKRKKLRTITWEECGKRMDKEFTRNTDYDMFWGRYHNKELIRVHFFLKKREKQTSKQFLAITEKNIDKVCSYVLEQMEDNNGRGEFDHLTPLSSAIERTIGSFEEEHFDYLDYIEE